ncbi:hypothetical protein Tco_0357060 [Tanacetum coccineum]
MVKPEKPLKKKDQIALDEELALRLHAEEQAELEKKELPKKKLAKQKLLKNWIAFKKVKNVSSDDSKKEKVLCSIESSRAKK